MQTSSLPHSSPGPTMLAAAISARWVCTTPFCLPSTPDVYMMAFTSSSLISTAGETAELLAIVSLNESLSTSMTCRSSGRVGRTEASISTKLFSVISTVESESRSKVSYSGALSMALSITLMAPALTTPK